MEKRPASYFGFFGYLKQKVVPNVGVIDEVRSEITKRQQGGESSARKIALEIMDEALDSLQPMKTRAILYVLENDLRVPLHEIVRDLRERDSK